MERPPFDHRLPDRLRSSTAATDLVLACLPQPTNDDAPLIAHLLAALWSVVGAIDNGGVEGLVTNPSGDDLGHATALARDLGLTTTVRLFEAIGGMFEGGYPSDAEERNDVTSGWSDDRWEVGRALTSSWDSTEARHAIAEYIAANPADFWTDDLSTGDEARAVLRLADGLVALAASGDQVARAAVLDAVSWADSAGDDREQYRARSIRRRLDQMDRWATER